MYSLPPCRYGAACYRKNTTHLNEFSHPVERDENEVGVKRKTDGNNDCNDGAAPSESKRRKIDDSNTESISSEKCGVFLSRVDGLAEKWNENAISLRDFFAFHPGQLERSIHFNFMVQIDWLLDQYPADCRSKPMDIVVGESVGTSFAELKVQTSTNKRYANISVGRARLPMPYGTHHTKMTILQYSNGLRLMISTANLVQMDWAMKTQGVFVTPLLPPDEEAAADGKTEFQQSLIFYLKQAYASSPEYNSLIRPWVEKVAKHDFSQVTGVHLVGSIPGRYTAETKGNWGHLRLRHLLNKYAKCASAANVSPVIAQCSSIGSLGPKVDSWLTAEFLTSLTGGGGSFSQSRPALSVVYPTVADVRNSLEGYLAGGSLPYRHATHVRQPYLQTLLHRWTSDNHGRSRAMPHIKSYARFENVSERKLKWFLLTSANLSKAAWGELQKNASQLSIRSYELGVLFVGTNNNETLSESSSSSTKDCSDSQNTVEASWHILRLDDVSAVLPYDFPLQRYDTDDLPWMTDRTYTDVDVLGMKWPPE